MRNKFVIAVLVALTTVLPARAQNNGNTAPSDAPEYKANILRLAPITAMDVGVGFAVSYERLFGADQRFGVILPVSLLLENKNSPNINTTYSTSRYNTYVYFTPGVKLYPFGQRKVTYAIGTNLMIGYGGGSEWQPRTDPYGVIYLDAIRTTRWRLGVLLNNYVNFQFSKKFNLGIDGGLGIRYLDKVSYSGSQYYAGNGAVNNGFDITGQFSLTLGYRF